MLCDGASPSSEQSGLLSLPWEMVTHIASHLSAQCVISVLPKVSLTNDSNDDEVHPLLNKFLLRAFLLCFMGDPEQK